VEVQASKTTVEGFSNLYSHKTNLFVRNGPSKSAIQQRLLLFNSFAPERNKQSAAGLEKNKAKK